ncbi:MAG: 4Fe-4S binding protein [Muribaculaceae bacterium]|nr:4Fe-4S binding protein [Muribaculaceae bacterium]
MKPYGGIRLTRRVVAVAVAAGVTLCVAAGMRCALTRMQLLPAVLAGSAAWLLLWATATMALGRIYCSTACPMGALMDGVARLRMAWERGRVRRNGVRGVRPYRWRAASVGGRYSLLAIVVLCMALGFSVVPAVTDPYSAYARMVVAACRPLGVSLLSAVVAVATLVAVVSTAWRNGRFLCNTWCPVGSALSLVSRHSVWHMDVDTDLCVHCLKCVDACKAQCINPADMTVDTARCVVCFNCADVCEPGAMTFRRGQHRLVTPLMQRAEAPSAAAPSLDTQVAGEPVRMDRRRFLKTGIVAAAAGAAAVAGRASCASRRTEPWDPAPLKALNAPMPPGFVSRSGFLRRCTACGACVAACPTGVIRPSTRSYGLLHAMAATMDYGSGACLTDCTACTQVCAAGALVPLTLSEKRRFVVGKARIRLQNCLAYGRGKACGRCARRCPSGAISMRAIDGRRGPVADLEKCIGCGQCVAACPSTPYKAIVIEGTD